MRVPIGDAKARRELLRNDGIWMLRARVSWRDATILTISTE